VKVGLGRDHLFNEEDFDQRLFGRTWKLVGSKLVARSQLISAFSNAPALTFLSAEGILRRNANHMLAEYQENVRIVRALARDYGFLVVHFWQPSLFSSDKKLTAEEAQWLSAETYAPNKKAHDLSLDVIRETAFFEETGVIDLTTCPRSDRRYALRGYQSRDCVGQRRRGGCDDEWLEPELLPLLSAEESPALR
jgi:hypothetical protein